VATFGLAKVFNEFGVEETWVQEFGEHTGVDFLSIEHLSSSLVSHHLAHQVLSRYDFGPGNQLGYLALQEPNEVQSLVDL
jgi:hypothetical protein